MKNITTNRMMNNDNQLMMIMITFNGKVIKHFFGQRIVIISSQNQLRKMPN